MKKTLLTGILLVAMSIFANAESNDDLDDDLGADVTPLEMAQCFKDDCNKEADYYGCFSTAMKYEKGEIFKKDIPKAIEYYNKACKFGSKKGCEMAKSLAETAK